MFQQITDPVGGSLGLSALVAALPLATLFVMLGVFRIKAHLASLASLGLALLLALLVWQMPVGTLLGTTTMGAAYGVFPILWILVSALWVYKLTVITGWFEVLGDRIRQISDDQRILAILIAFCFGALMESLAGFGAPVAISVAMLIAAGMKPFKAAIVSLLANTAPVAFGAMAAPIIALSGATGIEVQPLAEMAGRQTPFIALIVPLILVFLVDGKRGVKQTWPVALVAGFVFGVAQFVTANYIAVEITDIVAAIVTVGAVLGMLKVWSPADSIGFATEGGDGEALEVATKAAVAGNTQTVEKVDRTTRTAGQLTWGAVLPYVIIITIFSISQLPPVKTWLAENTVVRFPWPGVEYLPAATDALPDPSVVTPQFTLNFFSTPGTLLLLSGFILMAVQKISFKRAVIAYRDTVHQLRYTIVTVATVLALAYVMNFSGQTGSLGLALAATGTAFALLSPVIGWIGVAITGSDTSSNALFGALQVTAAQQAGLDPVLMASANSSAGVLGKMLSPQNLAVAAAAATLVGKEGDIFRKLIWWSLGLLVLFTGLIYLQTNVLAWMVPEVLWTAS